MRSRICMPTQSFPPLASAADFFRSQQAPPLVGKTEEPRRPVRESLLVVARNSQVKNKINAFDRVGGPVAGSARSGPAHGIAGAARLPPPRRVGAAPALGAIAEEAVGAAPARRHAAVVSTATAGGAVPPRRHADAAMATALAPVAPHPPQPVLPSPGTKQELAEKRHEARFPSIMFRPPPQQAALPGRCPLVAGSGSKAVQAAPATAQQATSAARPMPATVAPARTSLSPRQRQQELLELQPAATASREAQREQRVLPQTVAAVLAAEAAAAVRGGMVDSEDEDGRFVDAESGGGSGGLSLEGSAGGAAGV